MKRLSRLFLPLCVALLAALPSGAAPARAAFPSSQAPVTFASGLGGKLKDAYVGGSLAYLLEGANLTILDISDPTQPRVRSRTGLPGLPHSLIAINGYVYVLRYGTLWIYDARDPGAPAFVRELLSPAIRLSRMTFANGMLWLSTPGDVTCFDLQDPTRPALLSSLTFANQFLVAGPLVYIVNNRQGLTIWDASNPRAPVLRGQAAPLGAADNGHYSGVALDGTTLYVAGSVWHSASQSEQLILTFDVSDPSKPNLKATGTAGADQLYLVGGKLTTAYNGELLFYTMADPLHPSVEARMPLSDVVFQLAGSQLYTWNQTTWTITDLANPSAPAPRGQYQTASPIVYGVTLAGTRLYAQFSGGLQIIDVTNPLSPTLQALIPVWQNQFADVAIDGTRLLKPADGGFQLIDASDPLSPTVRAELPAARAARFAGDLVYLVSNADPAKPLFQVLDISDMAEPRLVASLPIAAYRLDNGYHLQVGDGRAYVGQSDPVWPSETLLTIVDVTDPQQLRAGAPFTIAGSAMVARGTLLFGLSSKLQVIDARDIHAPTVADFPSSGTPRGVEVVGSTAYLPDYDGVSAVDLRDPQHPALLGRYRPGAGCLDLRIADGRAYAACPVGLRVLDIARSPATPLPTATYGTYVASLAVADGYAYLAMDEGGLQIVQLHPERFVKPLLLPQVRKAA
jgi:hypothetical protein